MEDFTKHVREKIFDCEKRIGKHFDGVHSLDVKGNTQESPFNKAFADMWGCDEKCPFCGEFCRLDEKHEGIDHECLQHKPGGINGYRWKETNKLTTENCSYAVQS